MEFKKLGLAFTAAFAAGVIASACGGGSATLGNNCSSNAGCSENEICHPTAGVCVESCTAAGDCPTGACTTLSGSGGADGGTGAQGFCSCADDAACTTNYGPDFTCLTASGACAVSGQGNVDPGPQACDPASTTFNADKALSNCNYGEYCEAATTQCKAVAAPTCTEAQGAPTWNQTAKLAPVITAASAVKKATTSTTTECGDGGPAAIVTISLYDADGFTTHTTFSDLANHVKFKTGASFVGANFPVQNPPANMKTGTFQVGIACGQPSGTAAIYVQDEQGNTSNVVCVSWQ